MSAAPDPAPWVHTSGERVADPWSPSAPQGGYTHRPRHGYSDHPDRYVSTRSPERDVCAECAHECIEGCCTYVPR